MLLSYSLNDLSHAFLFRRSESLFLYYFFYYKQLKSSEHLPSFASSWPFSTYNENTTQTYILYTH